MQRELAESSGDEIVIRLCCPKTACLQLLSKTGGTHKTTTPRPGAGHESLDERNVNRRTSLLLCSWYHPPSRTFLY